MATMPTDDPLERTVGVRWELDYQVPLESLKREALLFDQIAIPNLDQKVASNEKLYWLRDNGIVRDINTESRSEPTANLQYLDEMGEPIDVIAIRDERFLREESKSELYAILGRPPQVKNAVLSRVYSIDLPLDGISGFPI